MALSEELEFQGRIGLHSLPQANGFYANACGMTDLGADADHQGLRYFEMTPEQARAFVAEGEGRNEDRNQQGVVRAYGAARRRWRDRSRLAGRSIRCLMAIRFQTCE